MTSEARDSTVEQVRRSEAKRERERVSWRGRAKSRLLALVSTGDESVEETVVVKRTVENESVEEESVEEPPEQPTVEPVTSHSETVGDAEESEFEDEREEDPIPADD